MFKTLKNAFEIKDIRSKMLYTIMIIVVVRIGCQIPIPGVDTAYYASWFTQQTGGAFNFLNAMTGGSFTSVSIFALNISPYITASIIMQLLTIAVPKLEEMQKDGEEGQKKIAKITRYVTIALAILEGAAMTVAFGRSGALVNYNWYNAAIVTITMTAGSAMLMWMGERITEKGIGNGISIILLINILSSFPKDIASLFGTYVFVKNVAIGVLAAVIIIAIILALVAFVVMLNAGERRVPVQYSKKMQGRKMVGGQTTHIPIKVNTAGVVPVIFASSIMSTPKLIASFFTLKEGGMAYHIINTLDSANWFSAKAGWIYSIGVLIYLGLIIAFAYFYTSISFNPIEVANNMKKQGGFIPGIRPGRPTSEYLNAILNCIVFVGAVGIMIVAIIPIIFSGTMGIENLSFGGTSLIIIVGVILETLKQIESLMVVRNYKGFLND